MQGVRGSNPLSSTRHNARIPLQVVAKVSLIVFPEHSKCLTSSAIGAHVVERCFNRLKQVRVVATCFQKRATVVTASLLICLEV